ncbi:MAG: hypothetical protein PHT62_04620 [Desulfotomaculaceae bacterium]|nr:hypothetical protein [Desulfotomaculaceae bacterium]
MFPKTAQGCGADIVAANINDCMPLTFENTINCSRQGWNIGA